MGRVAQRRRHVAPGRLAQAQRRETPRGLGRERVRGARDTRLATQTRQRHGGGCEGRETRVPQRMRRFAKRKLHILYMSRDDVRLA